MEGNTTTRLATGDGYTRDVTLGGSSCNLPLVLLSSVSTRHLSTITVGLTMAYGEPKVHMPKHPQLVMIWGSELAMTWSHAER